MIICNFNDKQIDLRSDETFAQELNPSIQCEDHNGPRLLAKKSSVQFENLFIVLNDKILSQLSKTHF